MTMAIWPIGLFPACRSKPKHLQQMIKETGAQEILLALPSVSRARRKEILCLSPTRCMCAVCRPCRPGQWPGQGMMTFRMSTLPTCLGGISQPREDLLERCIQANGPGYRGRGLHRLRALRQIIGLGPTTCCCSIIVSTTSTRFLPNWSSAQRIAFGEAIAHLGSVRNQQHLADVMLGRDPVPAPGRSARTLYSQANGPGYRGRGSIGSELCRQIIARAYYLAAVRS